jgi:hypothetical protein
VRCDEQKPACNRCISTGRKCEGYKKPPSTSKAPLVPLTTRKSSPTSSSVSSASTSQHSFATPAHPHPGLKLALPRSNVDEVRSFRYFLEVTAPLLAGVFEVDFWLHNVPQACHADSAIWHAAVALGAVHEMYLWPRSPLDHIASGGKPDKTAFALQQFNQSIRTLTLESSRSRDRYRAVTASVIFTWICGIQNLHKEARMHIDAGSNLITELDSEGYHSKIGPQPAASSNIKSSRDSQATISTTIPVSMPALKQAMTGLNFLAAAMESGELTSELTNIFAMSDRFNVWRYYKVPGGSASPEDMPSVSMPSTGHYATRANLVYANRAAESLMNSASIFRRNYVMCIISNSDAVNINSLLTHERAYNKCLGDLLMAMQLFMLDLVAIERKTGKKNTLQGEWRAVLTLKLFISGMWLLKTYEPGFGGCDVPGNTLASTYEELVGLAEEILQLEDRQGSAYVPVPPPSSMLYLAAGAGYSEWVRKRAIELLREYPRQEGLWDTIFAARLLEMIWDREKECEAEAALKNPTSELARRFPGGPKKQWPVRNKHSAQYLKTLFTGPRQAKVTVRSWNEWLEGLPGVTREFSW